MPVTLFPGATPHVAVMVCLACNTRLQAAHSVLPCKICNWPRIQLHCTMSTEGKVSKAMLLCFIKLDKSISDCAVQQLYIYAGILAVNATINSAPLKVLVRVAKVGAVWQVLGQLPPGSCYLSSVSPKGFWHTVYCQIQCASYMLHAQAFSLARRATHTACTVTMQLSKMRLRLLCDTHIRWTLQTCQNMCCTFCTVV